MFRYSQHSVKVGESLWSWYKEKVHSHLGDTTCFSHYSNKNHDRFLTITKVLLLLKSNHMQESWCTSQSPVLNSWVWYVHYLPWPSSYDYHVLQNIAVCSLRTNRETFCHKAIMFPLKKSMAKQISSKYCKSFLGYRLFKLVFTKAWNVCFN